MNCAKRSLKSYLGFSPHSMYEGLFIPWREADCSHKKDYIFMALVAVVASSGLIKLRALVFSLYLMSNAL